jgi:hypothetical protein
VGRRVSLVPAHDGFAVAAFCFALVLASGCSFDWDLAEASSSSGGAPSGGGGGGLSGAGGFPGGGTAGSVAAGGTAGSVASGGTAGSIASGGTGTGGAAGGGGTPACVPKTCAELGVKCNKIYDGCGTLLTCGGACPAPACGDGACSPGETCPSDCCTVATPCTVTLSNHTDYHCNSLDGADNYAWITMAEAEAFCDEPSEVCVATAYCNGIIANCSASGFVQGPCQ